LNQTALFHGQSPPPLQFNVPIFWQPGRHETTLRHLRDLRGVLVRVAIIQQGKRRRFARPMAPGAVPKDDGRNVLIESDGAARPRGVTRRRLALLPGKPARGHARHQQRQSSFPKAEGTAHRRRTQRAPALAVRRFHGLRMRRKLEIATLLRENWRLGRECGSVATPLTVSPEFRGWLRARIRSLRHSSDHRNGSVSLNLSGWKKLGTGEGNRTLVYLVVNSGERFRFLIPA